jgi:fructokinase
LRVDELKGIQPEKFSLYHCGGIVLADEPAASSYLSLADRFVRAQIPISLDPTVRKSLISDTAKYVSFLSDLVSKVSILKVSDEELEFMTGTRDFDQGVKLLPARKGALVFVTLGKHGSSAYRDGVRIAGAPGFSVDVVETTGCGDSFMAAILAQLAGKSLAEMAELPQRELESIMRFANAEAAIVAMRVGAAEANPTRKEIEQFLAGPKAEDRLSRG